MRHFLLAFMVMVLIGLSFLNALAFYGENHPQPFLGFLMSIGIPILTFIVGMTARKLVIE